MHIYVGAKTVIEEHDVCKKCGGFVEYDKRFKLPTDPMQYKGKCSECGEIHYEFCHKVDLYTNTIGDR